jgi:hypothetical protein
LEGEGSGQKTTKNRLGFTKQGKEKEGRKGARRGLCVLPEPGKKKRKVGAW